MSLIADGRTALKAMLDHGETFQGIADREWSSAAIRLAKKQLTAARQDRANVVSVKNTLGDDMFERALDALSAYHVKILAKRVDPTVAGEAIESASMARQHIRTVMSPDWQIREPVAENVEPSEPTKPKGNPYIGRKAFRTGR
ncbi:MAG: hypothetical protein AAF216_07635 [Pseudomonadota bacterium]